MVEVRGAPATSHETTQALRDVATEFVRREVAPHLQDWEDAGTMPRELHLAAAKQGLLGLGFPEEVGGQGGDLLDSVAMQEAMFEAGASSGLLAGLFTHGIALPHMVSDWASTGAPTWSTASCGPPWPARRSGRWRSPSPVAAPTSPASAPRRAARATSTSSTAPRPSSPAASAPTS